MNTIFEKFGIFDFMGIWGPGAITVTYYFFTIKPFFTELFSYLNMPFLGISEKYLIILFYTAVAYTVGVCIHEIGKIIYDLIPLFDLDEITYFHAKKSTKRSLIPLCKIRYDYNHTIDSITNENSEQFPLDVNFETARGKLKYNDKISSKRTDTYHSVYAFARGMTVSFTIHILIVSLSLMFHFATLSWWLVVVDLALIAIFFFRAYRYFLAWIKNTYVQYYLNFVCKGEKSHEFE